MDITSRRQEVCYTVDVLSDGSEFTGRGSLFLSVWKKPRDATPTNMSWLEEVMEISSPIGRYAISGIGDLSSRLAADQRFKLAPTRAVFAPTCDSLDGLSALLLALSSSGAPSLHLASTRADSMEELATIVLGSRRYLQISNCQVPHGGGWWEVYADPHLTVHCSRRDPDNQDDVTFLYSMCSGSDNNSTLALLPPGCTSIRQSYDDLVGNSLPILNNSNNHPVRITALIALDPYDAEWETVDIPNCLVMVTKPQVSSLDPAILERSQSVINYLSKELPEAFGQSLPHMQHDADDSLRCRRMDLPTVPFQLFSGTSIVLADFPRELTRGKSLSAPSMGDAWASTITSLQSFQAPTLNSPTVNTDENEIDLDDPDDCDESETDNKGGGQCSSMDASQSPMLVVLGTGCATPSAVRGASAYALTVPSTENASEHDMFLLDCGEGVTTMLSRFGPKDWQRRIRGAWISHAHLDHYGGLANLVRIVDSSRHEDGSLTDSTRDTNSAKRQKTIPRYCCWVMAPPKVLRYLDLCLNCHHGRHKVDGHEVFKPLLHHDPTTPPGPWSYFQSIKVPHNCYPAYALLTGWPKKMLSPLNDNNNNKQRQQQPMSWFCFSGDTRPSGFLVQQCRGVRRDGDAFFLVHEATFEDTDQDQAELKKHSTVSEAISVAKDIGATRLLLTHFSQRYVSLQGLPVPGTTDTNFRVGLAMDGLHVILE